jgi:hypothetical protein
MEESIRHIVCPHCNSVNRVAIVDAISWLKLSSSSSQVRATRIQEHDTQQIYCSGSNLSQSSEFGGCALAPMEMRPLR